MKSNLFISLGKILKPTDTLNDVEGILEESHLIPCDQCGCYFPEGAGQSYGGYNFCSDECKNQGIPLIEDRGDELFDADRDERLINGDFPFDQPADDSVDYENSMI